MQQQPLKLFDTPLCIWDLETTSADTATARIVQIAVRKLMPDGTITDKSMLINPEIPIPAEATEVHGITDAMVADQPTLKRVSKAIWAFLSDSNWCGYNLLAFDVPVLVEELLRCDIEVDLNRAIIDAYNIFRNKEKRDLTAALMFYCQEEMEGAHDAMNDVVATTKVLFGQVAKYEDLKAMDIFQLADFSIPEYQVGKAPLDVHNKFYVKDGYPYFNGGKHKDERIDPAKHANYLSWIISEKCDYAPSTKRVAEKLLNPDKPETQASLF